MANKKKTSNLKIKGAKLSWTGKTRSGKGSVKLYAKKGMKGIKQTTTVYKTSDGKRRILQITTYKKVIK